MPPFSLLPRGLWRDKRPGMSEARRDEGWLQTGPLVEKHGKFLALGRIAFGLPCHAKGYPKDSAVGGRHKPRGSEIVNRVAPLDGDGGRAIIEEVLDPQAKRGAA